MTLMRSLACTWAGTLFVLCIGQREREQNLWNDSWIIPWSNSSPGCLAGSSFRRIWKTWLADVHASWMDAVEEAPAQEQMHPSTTSRITLALLCVIGHLMRWESLSPADAYLDEFTARAREPGKALTFIYSLYKPKILV